VLQFAHRHDFDAGAGRLGLPCRNGRIPVRGKIWCHDGCTYIRAHLWQATTRPVILQPPDCLADGTVLHPSHKVDNGFIIVFTSNISKENFTNKISPELRSRFDYKGLFTLLYNQDKKKFVEFRVKSIIKNIIQNLKTS
jgi:hypothetical protein